MGNNRIELNALPKSHREQVEAMSKTLPITLPWEPVMVPISERDASEPGDLRFGNRLIVRHEGVEWSLLGESNVNLQGYRVNWEMQFDPETGNVIALARPRASFATRVDRVRTNFPANLLQKELVVGTLDPLVQVWSTEVREEYPTLYLPVIWMTSQDADERRRTHYQMIHKALGIPEPIQTE